MKTNIQYGGFVMKFKKMVSKLMSVGVVNSLALLLVAQNVNQACVHCYGYIIIYLSIE